MKGNDMALYKVGYLVGSLASASINRLLAKALARLAPQELVMSEIPIRDLFVMPEYNRSVPGALKNAIDWASRPWGQNSFARKPSGVIGTSPGAIGTAVAQQQLRSVLCYCNSPLMNTIEAYIQFKPGLITEDGQVTDEKTVEFLRNYMSELHAFIVRVLTVLPRKS
jgi:chromate reductase